ncbi:MAG TPA: DegT/DnrJ/EryC1/StrS family aminotransferase [Candidatus Tripitaka californicus]|uniref:DegT/DnrJ/EryC1/StrS family aminotransferase n=1 Tax=Candidatus Tripitaka californicus TaxID=3367616 RepID=UPI0040276F17
MRNTIVMEKIQLVDLQTQYQGIQEEVHSSIRKVIEEGAFILGKYVKEFEESFASFCRARYAVGVANGTDALILALRAMGIGPGHEVITAPNSAAPTAEAIGLAGAKVVFADINPETYNLDTEKVKKAITSRTKAIIPVHLYGQPADMDAFKELAMSYGLRLIEDAAQAHGAEYKGVRVGNLGEAACFSFYPSKNLGAYGDGGAVVTNDPLIAEKVRMLRDHGRKEKYIHEIEGYNSRLDAIQAVILSIKLKYLEGWNEKRRERARQYDVLLSPVQGVTIPRVLHGVRHVYHIYAIKVENRDGLKKKLKEMGIQTGIHYPLPLHLQPAYAHLGLPKGTFPMAEEAASKVLSLPLYPEMRVEQVEAVAEAIRVHIS